MRNGTARAILAVLILVTATLPALAQGKIRLPRFADYPVKEIYKGPRAEPKFPADMDEEERLRFDDAHSTDDPVDAAGHYVRVVWGCGAACVSSGFVDARTGDVVVVPWTVSGWRQVRDDFKPVDTRANSRLVVLSGALNEEGVNGRHYCVLEDGRLKHVRTVATKGSFLRGPR